MGFDTETAPWPKEGVKRKNFTNVYNMTEDGQAASFDPHTCAVRLLQLKGDSSATVYVWDMWKIPQPKEAVRALVDEVLVKGTTLVAHNIKFDLKMIASNYGIWLDEQSSCFDTQQASRLIANAVGLGKERRHRLKDLSRDFLGIDLDKTEQTSDWSRAELSQTQIDYAAADVLHLHELYTLLKNGIEKDYQMPEALAAEMDCLGPTARMEFNGVPINLKLYRKVQEAAQYAMPTLLGQIGHYFKEEIGQTLALTYVPVKVYETGKEILTPFMLPWGGGKAGKDFLMSRANLVKDMIQRLGLVDEQGEPLSTTEKAALMTYRDSHEGVAQLLDYWNLVKQAQFEYDKYTHPITGCLHPRFQAGGASTGRFSCTSPNLQQVPAKLKMDHPDGTKIGFRNCFEAPKGWLMCSADFSGQELNVMAAMSQDPVMLKTLNDGGDLHSEAAAAMFNIPISDVKKPKPGDPKGATYRDYGKIVNFSLAYGKTAAGFAADWKIDKKEAEDIIDKFEKRFSVLSRWLKGHGQLGVSQGFSRLDFGPIRFVGEAKRADKDAPKRAAMNYQIQGLSSWMSRRAMVLLDTKIREEKLPIQLSGMIHDEVLCIFKPAESCSVLKAIENGSSDEEVKAAREICGEGCCETCTVKLENAIGTAMRDAGEYFLQGRVPAGFSIGTDKYWKH